MKFLRTITAIQQIYLLFTDQVKRVWQRVSSFTHVSMYKNADTRERRIQNCRKTVKVRALDNIIQVVRVTFYTTKNQSVTCNETKDHSKHAEKQVMRIVRTTRGI